MPLKHPMPENTLPYLLCNSCVGFLIWPWNKIIYFLIKFLYQITAQYFNFYLFGLALSVFICLLCWSVPILLHLILNNCNLSSLTFLRVLVHFLVVWRNCISVWCLHELFLFWICLFLLCMSCYKCVILPFYLYIYLAQQL